MSDSVRPHRRQPARLPHPWDPPGKNTGVGCHFLLQCMKVKSESEVTQSWPTLSNPMDCSLPGSSIHGILQARVLEWGAIVFSVPYCIDSETNSGNLIYCLVPAAEWDLFFLIDMVLNNWISVWLWLLIRLVFMYFLFWLTCFCVKIGFQ